VNVSENGRPAAHQTPSRQTPSGQTVSGQPGTGPNRRVRWPIGLWTFVATVGASAFYTAVVAGGSGLNWVELISIAPFAVLFGWIAFSFGLATLGWLSVDKSAPVQPLATDDETPLSKTAVLMPVYNESPERVFAGVAAMIASLKAAGDTTTFDFFVLSDTTNHEVWLQEEHAWSQLQQSYPDARIFYRHRPKNTSRKAGNIADFCERWGRGYAYMIVLDADSLVEGRTMIELTRRMDADDRLGILQVPPVPIGRHSLFARIQQFSAAAYGRIFVNGFAAWAGSDGNYWGHNAILRVQPFLDHCDLPLLPGKAPLGGEILSHDFVEAALMLRNGWKVELATDLGGSYEECPPTLADYAIRDQRWCQGNMQHARLIISEGYHPLSRFHFSSGVMAYAASPMWIAFTLLCITGTMIDRSYRPVESSVSPVGGAMVLFIVSMAMLLLPKIFSLISISRDESLRSQFGGAVKLWASGLTEIVLSIALSPIMALFHSRFVLMSVIGKSVKWSAQQRDELGVSWGEATRQFWPFTLVGCIAWYAIVMFAPSLTIWFAPMLVGLIISIPLAVAMGSIRLGKTFARLSLLIIPEETRPPEIAITQARLLAGNQLELLIERPSLFETVILDPAFHLLHTHIQSQTGSDTPLTLHQSKAIEAAFAAGGAEGIPVEVRSALLGDLKTLQALHLEAQLKQAGV
jgi:membrane glycosyltransferase